MSKQTTAITGSNRNQSPAALPTFMDHIQELKSRLFFVAVGFVVSAGIAYPFFQDIINILVKPLGHQRLYYLSPAGGLSFILKVCMYAGFIGVLPVMVYQLYKFIAPVMPSHRSRAILGYTVASTLLAVAGIAFAYFVSLPAALHFLTGIDLNNITAMLTIDAYMSFIMAYLLAGALLFQLPLIMLIINSVTPLKPKTLMSYQRHMIVASFVMAAIVSPTPDVVNQTLLAAPIVVMYQIGIIIVWLKQRGKNKVQIRQQAAVPEQVYESVPTKIESRQPALRALQQATTLQHAPRAVDVFAPAGRTVNNIATMPVMHNHPHTTSNSTTRIIHRTTPSTHRRSIDGMVGSRSSLHPQQNFRSSARPQASLPRPVSTQPVSIDGFFMPQRIAGSRQTAGAY